MYQFDAYINSILSDLNISKKQKNEMAEEFEDHLERLKQEYIDKGLSEDEAVVKAIEDFGNGRELSKKLSYSLLNYRTKTNILFGVVYIVFALLLFKIYFYIAPLIILLRDPINLPQLIKGEIFIALWFSIIYSPIGYFIPIIFIKVKKLTHIVLINILILSFIYGLSSYLSRNDIALSFIPHATIMLITVATLISIPIEGLFSSTLGYKMLNIVSNRTSKFKELVSK